MLSIATILFLLDGKEIVHPSAKTKLAETSNCRYYHPYKIKLLRKLDNLVSGSIMSSDTAAYQGMYSPWNMKHKILLCVCLHELSINFGFRINSVLRKCIFEGNQNEIFLLNFLERLYRYLETLSSTTISIQRQISKTLFIMWKDWPIDDSFNANAYVNCAFCHNWHRNAPTR